MNKIFKNIIFCSAYCLANWLIFIIVFNIFFLIFKRVGNNIHINLLASILFIIVTYIFSRYQIKSKEFDFENLKIKTIDIYVFVLVGILLATILFLLI
ncbi:MAG: hypothetical protein E7A51_08175, partial [Anaerococcus vaginalis]|nr:hypothetical protein [Anaerococcus vaginalis]